MRKFENIVQGEAAPKTSSLWIKDNTLYYFNNGEWKPLGGNTDDLKEAIKNIIYNDSERIDSLKELEEFLEGVTNKDSLLSLLNDIKNNIKTDISARNLVLNSGNITATGSPVVLELSKPLTAKSFTIRVDSLNPLTSGYYGLQMNLTGYYGSGVEISIPINKPITISRNDPRFSEFFSDLEDYYNRFYPEESLLVISLIGASGPLNVMWVEGENIIADWLPAPEDFATKTNDNSSNDKIEIVSPGNIDEPLSITFNKYYRFDNPVNTLNIELPTIEDYSAAKSIMLYFTTGNTPAINIGASDSVEVGHYSGYIIEPNTTYELNIMFNGNIWVVAYAVIE